MMNFKNLFFSLFLSMSFLAGTSASASAGPNDKIVYDALASTELRLQSTMNGAVVLGVSRFQKNGTNPGRQSPAFCRKSLAVAPSSVPTYSCYFLEVSGSRAEKLYKGSKETPIGVSFFDAKTGGQILGKSWYEKSISIGGKSLCVVTAPVVPFPKYEYSCYSTSPILGGGVSGGN